MTEQRRRNLTVVTALVDLGRHTLTAGFERPYAEYLSLFPSVLEVDRPMVVFADADAEQCVWRHRSRSQTIVRRVSAADFERWPWWSDVQSIRGRPSWCNQAAWLADSPQARLPAYNPLVMSKLPWLADVSQENPFDTTAFVWVDSGLARTVPAVLLQSALATDVLLDRLGRFLFLCYPYESGGEIHGFPRSALAQRAGVADTRWVARGGFFGGAAAHIHRARAIYDTLLSDTLAHGLMGTEESIFTIMAHLHPAIFERYSIGHDGLVWPFFHEINRAQHDVQS